MQIPYTSYFLARNKDGRLNMFYTTPRYQFGIWFCYMNGEEYYGMPTKTYGMDFITVENSPYPITVDVNPNSHHDIFQLGSDIIVDGKKGKIVSINDSIRPYVVEFGSSLPKKAYNIDYLQQNARINPTIKTVKIR